MANKKPPQPQLTVVRTDTKPVPAKPQAQVTFIVMSVSGDRETCMAAIDQAVRAMEQALEPGVMIGL